jgi:CheY-like chemotaxis protein
MAAEAILVVDDNRLNLKLARSLLGGFGYEVVTCDTAEEALEALAKIRPLLILTDVRLPGMDGLALTRRLKADPATRGIPVVAMTAHTLQADQHAALAAGCEAYLSKPVESRTLHETIARVIAGERPRSAPAALPPRVSMLNSAIVARLQEIAAREPPGFLAELAALFEDSLRESLTELGDAARQGNPDHLARTAHRLGGSCDSVGATAMAQLCRDLETLARSGSIQGCQVLIDDLAEDARQAPAALRELMAAADGARPAAPQAGGMRVLVADDDPVSRRVLQSLLGSWGYRVELAATGDEAWARLQETDAPPLAIVDWVMPGVEGPELCRRVRGRPPESYVYLILLSRNELKREVVEGLRAGADDYLTKPFEPAELEARVRAGRRVVEAQAELLRARDGR